MTLEQQTSTSASISTRDKTGLSLLVIFKETFALRFSAELHRHVVQYIGDGH